VTFIVLCCIVLALAIHSAYFIKRFSLLTAMMSNKLLGLGLGTHKAAGRVITVTSCDAVHGEWDR